MHRYLLVLIVGLLSSVVQGQTVPPSVYYANLERQEEFPKGLQSKRAAAVINLDEDWEKFSTKVHSKLRLMSIDVIKYIDYRDLFAGEEVTGPVLDHLKERKVNYMVTFSKNTAGQYQVDITGLRNYLKAGTQKSASFSHVDLNGLLKYMANELIKAELEKTNFLIAEKPELLTDAAVLTGRKFDVHARDLQTLKLAVPRFQPIKEDVLSASASTAEIKSYNEKIKRWNKDLEEIMIDFPFKYEFVDTTDSRALYKEGFQYALFFLDTKGITIKKMLNLKLVEDETEYVSYSVNDNLKRISVKEPVAKFYVKHLYVNDVYLGDKWDADISWQASLRNYIYNYKKFMRIN